MTARALADQRYRLEHRLGDGGMATVYLALDPKLGRRVAVKLLAERYADDDNARRRFEREARLAAKLAHPNVVQVFDVGEEDGRPFIVMELVDGGTLADLIKRRRGVARERGIELFGQACAGLAHAHGRGLVHRDVKPQNLLLRREDGRLKVADFGIARAAQDARLTGTGLVLGTRPYMAPEQLEGGRVTSAADVYALGVVGRELFGDRVPIYLEQILRRSTAPDPKQRYRDGADLGEALKEAEGTGAARTTRRMRSEPKPATAPTRRQRSGRTHELRLPAPRSPALRPAAAVLAVAAVAAVALALILGGGGDGSGGGGGEKVKPAPRLADPEAQGRALADWLRHRSG